MAQPPYRQSTSSAPASGRSPLQLHTGQRISDAMATGLSLEAAATACGVGPQTAFTWQNQHDEFR